MMRLSNQNDVSMTQSWAHDLSSHEAERVTGKTTLAWFHQLDRWGARKKGLLRALDWLRDEIKLEHRLASTLAWNYFNPSTLPRDIVGELREAGALPAGSGAEAAAKVEDAFAVAPVATATPARAGRAARPRQAGASRSAKPVRKTAGKRSR